jgi:hypothetical protein
MNIANKTISVLIEKEVLVDVYTDYFNDSLYGFIKVFSDSFLLLEHYNEDGFYNGIVVFKREDITRLRWDNNEINSVQKLIKRHNQDISYESIDLNSIKSIIISIDRIFKHISLKTQNIDTDWLLIGKLLEIDDDTILLKEFGTMSSLDRATLMLSVDEITRIDADGIYENNILKIHSSN